MNRRSFLRSSVASGLAGLAPTSRAMARDEGGRFPEPPPLPFRDEKSDLKITNIRAVRLVPTRPLPKYQQTPGTWNTTEVEIANPLSIYPRFKPRRSLFYADDLGPDTVMVETNKGITGFGYGGPGAAFVVERHLPETAGRRRSVPGRTLMGHHVARDALLRQERDRGPRHQRGRQRPLGHRRQGARRPPSIGSWKEQTGNASPAIARATTSSRRSSSGSRSSSSPSLTAPPTAKRDWRRMSSWSSEPASCSARTARSCSTAGWPSPRRTPRSWPRGWSRTASTGWRNA